MRSPAPYARTAGAILAFLIVAVVTKFADVLQTYELTFGPPGWRTPLAQIATTFRFSWQEFATAACLLAVVALWQWRVPRPGRRSRIALRLLRVLLVAAAALTIVGIKYYGLYQGHMMITDFVEYAAWAGQLARSVDLLADPRIPFGALAGAAVFFGISALCARLPPRPAARLAPIALIVASMMTMVTWAAGRPRLMEAQLEPSPLVWLFWGPQATYFEPPPIQTLAPIGPQTRRFTVAVRPRNLILVVLESVPAHALASYNPAASAGRELAEKYGSEITTFEQIYADVPLSDSTVLSMLTGLSPTPTNQKALVKARERPTLAEILRQRGSHSEFLLSGPRNAMIAGLVARGFDRSLYMESAWPDGERYARLTWGWDDRLMFDYARRFLDNQRADSPPFFLVLYTSNPHFPYESGAIPGLDDHPDPKVRHARLTGHVMDLVTGMYERLKANGLAESTLVLAFGDHGQAFGEHRGNFVHTKDVYGENLHVPMMILHPTRLGLPPAISQLGALVDVMPTVLDILGIDGLPMDGMSLLNEAPERVLFHRTPLGPGVAGFRDQRYFYSLSRTGRELLFDRIGDPLEQRNIVRERDGVAAQFRNRLRGEPRPH